MTKQERDELRALWATPTSIDGWKDRSVVALDALPKLLDEIERLESEVDGYISGFDTQHEEIKRQQRRIEQLEEENRKTLDLKTRFDAFVREQAEKVLPREDVYGDGKERGESSLGWIVAKLVCEIQDLRKFKELTL